MRIANYDSRATLVPGNGESERGIDLAAGSRGRFSSELSVVYEDWDLVTEWVANQDISALAENDFRMDRA